MYRGADESAACRHWPSGNRHRGDDCRFQHPANMVQVQREQIHWYHIGWVLETTGISSVAVSREPVPTDCCFMRSSI